LSSSNDAPLSPASRDVFTGTLAQSVQELWPIKCSPETMVAGAGGKGTFYGGRTPAPLIYLPPPAHKSFKIFTNEVIVG